MQLKTNQSFTKGPTTKIINKKNKDQSGNPHKSKDNFKVFHDQHEFRGKKREEKKKVSSATSCTHNHTHHYKRKMISMCFQQHNRKGILVAGKSCTHHSKGAKTCVAHSRNFFCLNNILIFIKRLNYPCSARQ